jgi:restriction endonuclease Mrr
MKPSEYTKEIQQIVIEYLGTKQKALRKELFLPAIQVFNLTPKDLKDRKPGGKYSIASSMIGIVINEMVSLGILVYVDDFLTINKKALKTDSKEMIEFFSKKLLTEDELKERGPESKLNVIKSLIGNIFTQKKNLETKSREEVLEIIQTEIDKSKKIKDKLYNNQQEEVYPVTPIGNLLREHKNKYLSVKQNKMNIVEYNESTKNIIGQLFGQAEEFFEVFIFKLIKKIYGSSIIKEKFLAGPDDDGVDCEFEIKDAFGFKEKLIIQAKTKKTEKNLNVKVLREYLGVMLLKQAQKCVIITNSNFNKTALLAAKNIHSVSLIGLEELFRFMIDQQYGVIKDDQGLLMIDEKLFLNIDA